MLGSAVDPEEGHAVVLESPRVRFAIELPGSRAGASLQLPPMLPVRWVNPSNATFCASVASLTEGLGDPTVAEARAAQLRRVCSALTEVRTAGDLGDDLVGEQAGGRVAALAAAAAAARGGALTAPECFEALVVALDDSDGEAPPPSLTCMWNFIGALDQQLLQLSEPTSAMHAALQPDEASDVPLYESLLKTKLSAALLSILRSDTNPQPRRSSFLAVRTQSQSDTAPIPSRADLGTDLWPHPL